MIEIHVLILDRGKYRIAVKNPENNPPKEVRDRAENVPKCQEKKSVGEMIADARQAFDKCREQIERRKGNDLSTDLA